LGVRTWSDIERAANTQILDWAESQPWAREMAGCQQDAQWHAEGNVWTHTKMVCTELERLAEWPALDRVTQIKLLFAGLFHDSGKPVTTELDSETGRTRSPKHALVGAEIARRVLRELECDLVAREEIVALVRFHGRPPYLLGDQLGSLHYMPHEEYRCTVTLMSGLPGAGKDTWLAKHRPAIPVVALDAIREALEIGATDNQGQVIQVAREKCREHLRIGGSFAFSATNVIRQMRQRWIDLFADYGVRIEIVYLEPPLAAILAQNKRRPNPVPEKVILRLAEKLEPPTITECHSLTFG